MAVNIGIVGGKTKQDVENVDTVWDGDVQKQCKAKNVPDPECSSGKYLASSKKLAELVGGEANLKIVCPNLSLTVYPSTDFDTRNERLAHFDTLTQCKGAVAGLPEEAATQKVIKPDTNKVEAKAPTLDPLHLIIPKDIREAFTSELASRWKESSKAVYDLIIANLKKTGSDEIKSIIGGGVKAKVDVLKSAKLLEAMAEEAREIDKDLGYAGKNLGYKHIEFVKKITTASGEAVAVADISENEDEPKTVKALNDVKVLAKQAITEHLKYIAEFAKKEGVDLGENASDLSEKFLAKIDSTKNGKDLIKVIGDFDEKAGALFGDLPGAEYPDELEKRIKRMNTESANGWVAWARGEIYGWLGEEGAALKGDERETAKKVIKKVGEVTNPETLVTDILVLRGDISRGAIEEVADAVDKNTEDIAKLKGASIVAGTETGWQNGAYGVFFAQTNGVEAELLPWLYLTGEARVIALDMPPDVTRSGNPIGVYEDPNFSGLLIDKLNVGLRFLLSGEGNTLALRGGLFDPRKKHYDNDHSDITDFAYPAGNGWGVDATFKLWSTKFDRFGTDEKCQKSGFRARLAAYDPAKISLKGDSALAQFDSLSDSLMMAGDVGYTFTPVNWLTLTPQVLFAKGMYGEGIKDAKMVTPSLIADLYINKEVKVMMDGFYSYLNGDQDVWAVSLKPDWHLSTVLDLYAILTLSNTNISMSRGSITDGIAQESFSRDEGITSPDGNRQVVDFRGGLEIQATDWFALLLDAGLTCIDPGTCGPAGRLGLGFTLN